MLVVENISCQKGYTLLFQQLSFYSHAGDIVRILGKNGSGKTSLLKILAGIGSFDQGIITYNNYPISSSYYRENILYLGHNSTLSPRLSVFENLSFLAHLGEVKVNSSAIMNALECVGLQVYAHEMCYTLSAGQKRKTILALLYLSNADIWLLDEPFTALDSDSITLIESRITEHSQNAGMCILTTHQQSNLLLKEVTL